MIEIKENSENLIISLKKEIEKIEITITINEFDTQHFGITMATLNLYHTENINTINRNEIEELFDNCIKQCELKNINHIALKTNTKNYKIIHCAENCGFKLVNVSVEYAFDYKKEIIRQSNNLCKIRHANMKDINKVLEITKTTFRNFSRFHYDEFLENKKADELYEKWIINSFNGYADQIIVGEHNGEVVGFCTIKNNFTTINGEKASGAILAGVSETARGLGVYKSMLNEAIIIGSEIKNNRYMASSTQAQNIFVQRAWSDLGLKIYNCVYIFHNALIKSL